MALIYCSNETLKGVGKHIFGVYPTECEVCRTLRKKKNIKPKVKVKIKKDTFIKETWLANNQKRGIMGFDIWMNDEDRKRYNYNYHQKI